MSYLGLSSHQSLLSALWLVISLCTKLSPVPKEAYFAKAESNTSLKVNTKYLLGSMIAYPFSIASIIGTLTSAHEPPNHRL